jgi:hypothetical protein
MGLQFGYRLQAVRVARIVDEPERSQMSIISWIIMSIISWIILGLIAGFSGSKIVTGQGQGYCSTPR